MYTTAAIFILFLAALGYLISPILFPEAFESAAEVGKDEKLEGFIKNEEELDSAMGKSVE